MESLTSYVFSTLTYDRSNSIHKNWSNTSKDFNRFIQKLRRHHNYPVQYLRSIEAHKDGQPHLHTVLRFPNVIRVKNNRYFDQELYKKWKELWRSGLSDFQPPRSKRHPILYIVKYATKESNTVKTLWKKYYQLYNVKSVKEEQKTPTSSTEELSTTSAVSPVTILCKKYKVKQISWSRQFFSPHVSTSARNMSQSLLHVHTK